MTITQLSGEFSLYRRFKSDTRRPVRWLVAHTTRYWYLVLLLLVGAVSNAAVAAVIPIMVGRAFDAINQPVPDGSALLPIALFIIFTQIVRGALQFVRNFSAELLGQRLERDTR